MCAGGQKGQMSRSHGSRCLYLDCLVCCTCVMAVCMMTLCSDASGMVLHKESQWYQSWQSFKDNNQFVHSESLLA